MGKAELLILKGLMADMPEADVISIKECAGKLKSIISEYGDLGLFALGLVGLESQDGEH